MDKQKYLLRAVKRLIRLSVLIALVLALMVLTKTNSVPADELLHAIFTSWRGIALIGVIVAWSAVYPRMTFVSQRVPGDLASDKHRLDQAFAQEDYHHSETRGGESVYRSGNAMRRFFSMGEDAVTVTQDGDDIVLEGNRRQVVPVVYGFQAAIHED